MTVQAVCTVVAAVAQEWVWRELQAVADSAWPTAGGFLRADCGVVSEWVAGGVSVAEWAAGGARSQLRHARVVEGGQHCFSRLGLLL